MRECTHAVFRLRWMCASMDAEGALVQDEDRRCKYDDVGEFVVDLVRCDNTLQKVELSGCGSSSLV
jgi:hypothetical protein